MDKTEYIKKLKDKVLLNHNNLKSYLKVGSIINTICLESNIHYSRKITQLTDQTMITIPYKGYDLERKDMKKQLKTGLEVNINIYQSIIKDLNQGSYIFYIESM